VRKISALSWAAEFCATRTRHLGETNSLVLGSFGDTPDQVGDLVQPHGTGVLPTISDSISVSVYPKTQGVIIIKILSLLQAESAAVTPHTSLKPLACNAQLLQHPSTHLHPVPLPSCSQLPSQISRNAEAYTGCRMVTAICTPNELGPLEGSVLTLFAGSLSSSERFSPLSYWSGKSPWI
jgi:hypothetical protein